MEAAARKKGGTSRGWMLPIVLPRKASEARPARTHRPEIGEEVADHARRTQSRPLEAQLRHRLRQGGCADVEQGAALERARRRHRVEQDAHLAADPGPELHEMARAEPRHDLTSDCGQQRFFGARQVVLGEAGDLVEERAPAGVVEILRGKPGQRPRGQAGAHLGGHEGALRLFGAHADDVFGECARLIDVS